MRIYTDVDSSVQSAAFSPPDAAMDGLRDRVCRLCTREVSNNAINLFSDDSVERGVADRMANVLELPLGKGDGLSTHVCELCNARFKQLVRSLEVSRLQAKKSYDKLAKKAGIFVERE